MICIVYNLCSALAQTLVVNVYFISAEENYHPVYEKKQHVYISQTAQVLQILLKKFILSLTNLSLIFKDSLISKPDYSMTTV